MFKWIAGGCLVIAVAIGCLMFWGYRKAAQYADQPPSSIAIAATPERVFASVATAESLSTWRGFAGKPRMTRSGLLAKGDTIVDQNPSNPGASMIWVVDSVAPGKLIVSHSLISQSNMPMALRRDSLSAEASMTRVTTVIDLSPGPVQSKVMLGALRIGSQAELEKLKHRIDGTPIGTPDSGR
jgi:hypothetical protein